MKLLSLKARNIFSLGDVSLDLEDRGLTLITGWSYDDNNGNMAGKSNLANRVIVWGLYGKTVDGVRADSVINTSTGGKPCEILITFEGVDGLIYTIYRSRNPNRLQLTCNATPTKLVDLTKRIDTETQELINKVLGRDHKTFTQSDFFGQGRERSFLSLAGSEQRAVIEEILPLTSLDKWHKTAKEHTALADTKVEEAKIDSRLANERIETLSKKLGDIEAQHTSWGNEWLRNITEAKSRLKELQSFSMNLKEDLVFLQQGIPDGPVDETLEKQQEIRLALKDGINRLDVRVGSLAEDVIKLTAQLDTCTSCGQKLPREKIKEHKAKAKLTAVEVESFINARNEEAFKLAVAEAVIEDCKAYLDVQSRIDSKSEEAILTEHIKIKEMESNPFKTLLSALQGELRKEKENLKLRAQLIDKYATKLKHSKFWENAFGKDLKTLLFHQVCPYLEDKTNAYLNDLNNGQIKVKFSTNKELKSGDTRDEFCVTASSDTGSSIFELFSGAEKQLTSFAVGMALSSLASMQTEGASQFMILDEPFLYQSPENCENIVTFITQKLGGKSTILLISNEENLTNLISNRVHVVKRNGVSSIE